MTENPSLLRRIDNTHLPMILARMIVGGMFVYLAFHKIVDLSLIVSNRVSAP